MASPAVLWVVIVSTVAAVGLDRVPRLWPFAVVAVVVMLLSTWVAAVLYVSVWVQGWEAIASCGLLLLGWLAASGMVSAFFPQGLTSTNELGGAAALPLILVPLHLRRAYGLNLDRVTPKVRLGWQGWTALFVAVGVVAAALGINLRSEQKWLTTTGPLIFVDGDPAQRVVMVNRDPVERIYRVVVVRKTGRATTVVDFAAGSRKELSTTGAGATIDRVELYDDVHSTTKPVVYVTIPHR